MTADGEGDIGGSPTQGARASILHRADGRHDPRDLPAAEIVRRMVAQAEQALEHANGLRRPASS